VKPKKLNLGPDNLSRILSGEDVENLDEILPDAQLFAVKMVDDYFTDIVQFLSIGMASSDMTIAQKQQIVVKVASYKLIPGKLYNLGVDGILRLCVLEHERPMILTKAHKGIVGGNYAGKATMHIFFCVGL
jgi:hypothetical protein